MGGGGACGGARGGARGETCRRMDVIYSGE